MKRTYRAVEQVIEIIKNSRMSEQKKIKEIYELGNHGIPPASKKGNFVARLYSRKKGDYLLYSYFFENETNFFRNEWVREVRIDLYEEKDKDDFEDY